MRLYSFTKPYVFQHCSARFLERALHVLDPPTVIAVGRHAAEYFFQFEKLEEVVGQTCERDGRLFFVSYHTSDTNKPGLEQMKSKNDLTRLRGRLSQSKLAS